LSNATAVNVIRDEDEDCTISHTARMIASRKKGLTLPLDIGKFNGLINIEDIVRQCGATAEEHGFWESHAADSCKILGVPMDLFRAVFDLRHRNLEPMGAREELLEVDKRFYAARDIIDTCSNTTAYDPMSNAPEYSVRTMLKAEVISDLVSADIIGDPFIFLGLIVTETAEAMEAIRGHNWQDADGVWEELADVVIRIFDFVCKYGSVNRPDHLNGISPGEFVMFIKAKMAVNDARPYLHGKAF